MIKMSGAEWNRFYNDKAIWPENRWFEDEVLTIDDKGPGEDTDYEALPETAVIRVEAGIVFDGVVEVCSLEALIKRWRRDQKVTMLVAEVPNEKLEEVIVAIVGAGGKVRA